MNHIFKVIWNESLQAWQAVSERSSAVRKKGKSQKSRRALQRCALSLMVAMGGAPALADLPTGDVVRQGTASVQTVGNTMTIRQTTDRLVTDWTSFNVGAGKAVEFVQPSATAAALNRVTGADVSTIQGAIRANGQVFLLNPNGVLFTPTAQVNVGGLVASTLDMANADFMAGQLNLRGASTASVVNQGLIRAADGGSVALVAARIVNEGAGQIKADRGQVLMGAGADVTLDLGGPVKLKVNQGMLNALIEQGAAVQADGGLVYLAAEAAGQLGATVINHTGTTRARTLATGEGGRIYLMGGMTRDSVRVGGQLDASAPAGGHGGFVETSANRVLVADGMRVDTRAALGDTGNWLIDPNDYKVRPFGGDITGAALGTQLDTTSVTIQTVSQGTAGGNGDIFVEDPISKTTGSNTNTTLTLLAERDIQISKSISGALDSPLNLVLSARATGGATGSVAISSTPSLGDLSGIPLDLPNAANHTLLRTFGGDVTIGGGDATASGFAVRSSNEAGVRIYNSAIIDASSDGNATLVASAFRNWQGLRTYVYASASSTSNSGGNIVIRGQGNPTQATYNWGVQIQNGSLTTAGTGSITIDGAGGQGGLAATTGTVSWNVGSVGVVLERSAHLLAKDGNITITGRRGTGFDRYGIASTESDKRIQTGGVLTINGGDSSDGLLIRDGTLTLSVGQDSEISTPIVGCTVADVGCGAYTLDKSGTGILYLSGDARAWDAARPANTRATATTGTFKDDDSRVSVMPLNSNLDERTEIGKMLYAFSTLPPRLQLALYQGEEPALLYYLRFLPGSSQYGDAPQPSWAIFDDSVAGNPVTALGVQGTPTFKGVTATSNVGDYSLTYTGGLTSSTPGTLIMPGAASAWQVTRRPIDIPMFPQDKWWGDTDPSFTGAFFAEGVKGGATLDLSSGPLLSRAPGETPGRYPLTFNEDLFRANNPNYDIKSIRGWFTPEDTDFFRINVGFTAPWSAGMPRPDLQLRKRWGEPDPVLAQIPLRTGFNRQFITIAPQNVPGLVAPPLLRAPGEKAGMSYPLDMEAMNEAFLRLNPELGGSYFRVEGQLAIDPLPGFLGGLVSRVFPLTLPKFNIPKPNLLPLTQQVKLAGGGLKLGELKKMSPNLNLRVRFNPFR